MKKPSTYHPTVYSCPEIWDLAPPQFKLYVALLTFCGPDGRGVYPTNETLAKLTGANERSIQSQMKLLEKSGVVTRKIAYEKNGIRGTYRSIEIHYFLGTCKTKAIIGGQAEGTPEMASGVTSKTAPHGTSKKTLGVTSKTSPQRNIPTIEHSHKKEEVGQSITENQSTRASAVLPVAPSLSLSGRLLGMINASFPSNPNAVLHLIRMSGWDERRVEAGLLKTDPKKGVNYFASICRRMTDDEVEAMFAVPEAVPAEPKRVTSKDGRKVLINGEWLEAATPYPGLPAQAKPLPADHDPRLAEIYFIFWEEVCESLVPSIEGNLYWRIWQDLSDAGYEYKKGRMTADELRRKSEAILIEAGHPYTRKEGK